MAGFETEKKDGGRRFGKTDAVFIAAAAGILAFSLWLYARYGYGTLGGVASADMAVHVDFDIFRSSAVALLDGRSLYLDTGAPASSLNPPFFTLLAVPFAFMEPLPAYFLWTAAMSACQLFALAWISDELRMRVGHAVLAVGALLFWAPLLGTLAIGQMYPILTLGLAAAWIFDRRGMRLASGVALGLIVATKPSLAPILLWPLVGKRWNSFAAALASGAVATLAGILVGGLGAFFEWLELIRAVRLDGLWDNASLPGAASRMFRDNEFAEPLAIFPGALAAATFLGLALVASTAFLVRRNPETGLWAVAAAALLASPIAWHNYLVLLAPGILLLLARGRAPLALALISLGLIPQSWTILWQGSDTPLAVVALTLYTFVLGAHWLAFMFSAGFDSRVSGIRFQASGKASPSDGDRRAKPDR